MKKHFTAIIAAILCSVLFCATVYAQKPTLESVLPAAVQKNLPGIQADINFLFSKVLAVNPGFKNRATLPAQFNAAIEELKKQKPALASIKLPATAPSYDELLAAKTKQFGAQSSVVKILTQFKDGVAKADDNAGVVSLMVNLIKSPEFEKLAATDKDMFYYSFASAKIAADYGVKYNLYATAGNEAASSYAFVGGDDGGYYRITGSMACHWFFTVAGGAAGAVAGAGVGAGAGAAIGFAAGAKACY